MIEPAGKYLFVKMIPEDKSKGGILLPEDAIHPTRQCNVMAVGSSVSVCPGDLIIIERNKGIFVSDDQIPVLPYNDDYRIIHDDMVLGKVVSGPKEKDE